MSLGHETEDKRLAAIRDIKSEDPLYCLPIIDAHRTMLSVVIFNRSRDVLSRKQRRHIARKLLDACKRFDMVAPTSIREDAV